ncbi:regulatory protein RecX [Microbacterium sp. cx-59]|uniref:regulatory protein RecX n=1 Tax=Microbacterium sp. cx-59 TaxID=2891207 RepID=UPI001E40B55D|nr:regulatory protein RecX [Microbacterium sp. cx-59]MCC4909756.1 RecX family transcriptional regulator [Microbacterium sp. cx-59]
MAFTDETEPVAFTDETSGADDDAPAAAATAAEASLLRKLRARSLSVQEARVVLGGHGLTREQVDDILTETIRLGYLDDRALAEQLVHAGQDRRGQGRQAIGQTLSKRGVPRDVADAALAELPDDDMERALEFARRKAAGIGGRDAQAELRRLAGQLSRRGYPSHVALSAARQALDER